MRTGTGPLLQGRIYCSYCTEIQGEKFVYFMDLIKAVSPHVGRAVPYKSAAFAAKNRSLQEFKIVLPNKSEGGGSLALRAKPLPLKLTLKGGDIMSLGDCTCHM